MGNPVEHHVLSQVVIRLKLELTHTLPQSPARCYISFADRTLMPIEFACEACAQWLRVPDGSQGQSCDCPACQHRQTIPHPSSSNPQGWLQIACPACQHELKCAAELLGTKGQCKHCHTIFTIGQASLPQEPVAARPPATTFRCPQCDQLFEGRAEMQGRRGKCHVCGAVFSIALEAASSPRAASTAAPSPAAPLGPKRTTVAGPAAAPVASPPPAFIRFACQQCQGVMEVPGSTAGRSTQCPFCQSLQAIPRQSTVAIGPRAAGQPAGHSASSRGLRQQASGGYASGLGEALQELSTQGGTASDNPYAAPAQSPTGPLDSSDAWDPGSATAPRRALTFGNVFELTSSALLPYCLVAALLFAMVAGASFGLTVAAAYAAGSMLQSLQWDPRSTAGLALIYSLLGIATLVAVCLVTAAWCMTCNTALHAVRNKRITPQVLFGTGNAYPGMLVLMLGWTAFNVLRQVGVPWLAEALAGGQAELAGTIGLVAVIVLGLVQVVLMFLLAFVPYALLDGQDLLGAIGTSSSLSVRYSGTVAAANVCGALLYVFISVVTCGVGAIVFIGGLLYLNAAIYKLARK